MKTTTLKLSDIAKHPTRRMDAEYHIGKKEGKKAYQKIEGSLLIENDINGKIMLTQDEADTYNETMQKISDLAMSIAPIKNKLK